MQTRAAVLLFRAACALSTRKARENSSEHRRESSRRLLYLHPRSGMPRICDASWTSTNSLRNFEPMNIPEPRRIAHGAGYTESEADFFISWQPTQATYSSSVSELHRRAKGKTINLCSQSPQQRTRLSRDYLGYGPSITFFKDSLRPNRERQSAIAASIRLNTFAPVWSCLISSSPILQPSISNPSRTRSLSSAKN